MQKFENMDVIAALEAIMHQNTAYYQSDFAYDIKMLREAARSDQPEDKLLLWLSRPSGTFCFRERDVLLKDTQAYNTWKFCGEQTHDRILAYAVELTGAACGSRGSALLATQEGAPLPGLGIRYQPGDNSHRGDWVETRLSPAGASSRFVPVRPLPKTDDWFENVWKEYRQRKHL